MTKIPTPAPTSSTNLLTSPREASLSIAITRDGDAVRATIVDRRPDACEAFASLDTSRGEALAIDAWTLGLRAVTSAHRGAAAEHFSDIGDSLVAEIERRFEAYVAKQQQSIGETLRSYFDPRDGQVTMRLEAFLKDDGELSRTLSTYLAPEHGALARTLARELGEQSPLLRKLSPTDTEGVVVMIERTLQSALQQNQASLAKALDPLASDGAVARLIVALRSEMAKADKDQTEKLAAVTKALDANDERSLLSRLFRESEAATRAVVQSMNPDAPGSALALLRSSLTTQLDGYVKRNDEERRASEERQRKMVDEVREAVARLDERRQAEARSTRGGLAFEDSVAAFVQAAAKGAPLLVEAVGTTVGLRPSCKVGDLVVRHGAESFYAGSALVIEAKREKSYSVTRALEELELARTNRGATAGLFVMARSHAPAGFAGFRKFGDDILVVWDPEDASTDAYLEAGMLLGLALAARGRRPGDQGQIDALADIEHRIVAEIERHAKVQQLVAHIQRDAEAISRELETSDKKLGMLVKKAKQTLKALNVELTDVVEERKSPIGLPQGASRRGRKALGTGDGEE